MKLHIITQDGVKKIMYYGIILIPTNTYFDTKCNKYTIPTNLKIKTHNILVSQQHFSSFEILSCANCF